MPAGISVQSTTGSEVLDVTAVSLRPGLIWAIELKEESSAGGILLPDVGGAQKMRIGYCFAVGPGEESTTVAGAEKRRFIHRGDFFIFGKYHSGGEPITLNAVEVLQFRADDIAAKMHVVSERMLQMVVERMRKLQGLAAAAANE